LRDEKIQFIKFHPVRDYDIGEHLQSLALYEKREKELMQDSLF
jgi:hypothetical protein